MSQGEYIHVPTLFDLLTYVKINKEMNSTSFKASFQILNFVTCISCTTLYHYYRNKIKFKLRGTKFLSVKF